MNVKLENQQHITTKTLFKNTERLKSDLNNIHFFFLNQKFILTVRRQQNILESWYVWRVCLFAFSFFQLFLKLTHMKQSDKILFRLKSPAFSFRQRELAECPANSWPAPCPNWSSSPFKLPRLLSGICSSSSEFSGIVFLPQLPFFFGDKSAIKALALSGSSRSNSFLFFQRRLTWN